MVIFAPPLMKNELPCWKMKRRNRKFTINEKAHEILFRYIDILYEKLEMKQENIFNEKNNMLHSVLHI